MSARTKTPSFTGGGTTSSVREWRLAMMPRAFALNRSAGSTRAASSLNMPASMDSYCRRSLRMLMAVSVASDKSLASSRSSFGLVLSPIGGALAAAAGNDDEGLVEAASARCSTKNSSPAATIESGLRISCETKRTYACFWESICSLDCALEVEMRPGMMVTGTTHMICTNTTGQRLPSSESRHVTEPLSKKLTTPQMVKTEQYKMQILSVVSILKDFSRERFHKSLPHRTKLAMNSKKATACSSPAILSCIL
mmetsp:Transcript_63602/g.119388  ORF Transcript_63602/g.119388 Transcript_63602/m.119388 type:complete len:253 (-) Transcript_63602:618-1376(-)